MDVSPITNTPTQVTPNAETVRDTTSDFETFLKLLTTQLKNQDPLKPLESTDFVAQLANFSGVEQQVRTNEALDDLKSLLGQNSASGLASWIGAEVRAVRSLSFDGTPVDVFSQPASGADKAELVVLDSQQNELQRHQLPLQPGVYQWAGAGADGVPLANGIYSLKIESFRNGDLAKRSDVPIYGQVREARLQDGATMLVLSDRSEVSTDAVDAIRAADDN